ncbi:MAG: TolC family protein [Bacteroidetes bacterium]|nr:TolC family protein [Bacteroidota bacterium]MBT4410730.1 TolC family protein [Bacteroidota bacterium]MBT5427316.1 TolC family protein [Bacteroidota bacterium]
MKILIAKTTVVLFISFSSLCFGQEIHHMDLGTAIEVAKQQSPTMLSLMRQVDVASYNLKATNSRFKTRVSMNVTLPQYNETINKYEDSLGITFYPIRQSYMSTSLSISQPLPTDGSLSITSGIVNYTDYYADNRNAQVSTSIGLSQPIEALFGVNNMKLSMKQAKLSYDMTMKRLKRQKLDLVYIVSQSFYNLLSSREAMKIADMNMARQLEAYETAKNKYEAGLLREVEALQMEVDLTSATNQYENTKTSYKSQTRQFKETIGIEPTDSIVLLNQMEYIVIKVNPEDAVARAMKHRNELRESKIQIEIKEMNLKRQKAAGRISGNVNLNYNFIGVDKSSRSIPIGTTFENTWHNLTDRPGSFGVGLTARIPLIDWGENKARVKSAESSLEQDKIDLGNTKRSIEREIRSLVDQLHNSLRGLEIMEKSVVIAEKSFDISRQRYANDEIDSQAMALERERLNKAYTAHLSSYITYKLSLSDLMRKTFFDYERNEEVIDL